LLDLFKGNSREQLKKALSIKIEKEFKLTLRLDEKNKHAGLAYPNWS